MTSRDFCYWLQGHFEIANPQSLSPEQTEMVKRHLALVFKHEIDPSIAKPGTSLAEELNAIHARPPKPFPHSLDGGDMLIRC